jgi:hypothetical protein
VGGAGLERAVEPAEPVRQQLLALQAGVGEARALHQPLEVAGVERVHVDHRLERVLGVIGARRPAVVQRRSRLHQPPPQRRDAHGGALRPGGDAIALTRRLAGEEQRPTGAEHARELRERALERRQVVQHGVAEHEVEGRVVERELGGVAGGGLHLAPEPARVGLERLQHAGRDVGARRVLDDPGAEQVEREVAGARADLQRARVRAGRRAQQLGELAEHLRPADPAEVDAPLGVVVVGRDVVVAAVDVEDVVGGGGRGHAGRGG